MFQQKIRLVGAFVLITTIGCTKFAATKSSSPTSLTPASAASAKGLFAVASAVSSADTSCQIVAPICTNHAEISGGYIDYQEAANKDQATCLARAKDWFQYCGNTSDHPVEVDFIAAGKVLAKNTYPGDTFCQITNPSCPGHPNTEGTFIDYNEKANVDQATCLARVNDFSPYCGGQSSAEYFSGGKLISSQTVGAKTHCIVGAKVCPGHPELLGGAVDYLDAANQDEKLCISRANDWYLFCGADHNNPVSTGFFAGDTLLAYTQVPDNTYCLITTSSCQNPLASGTFLDWNEQAQVNQALCQQRANDYSNYCGGAKTTASYYSFGKILQSTTVGK